MNRLGHGALVYEVWIFLVDTALYNRTGKGAANLWSGTKFNLMRTLTGSGVTRENLSITHVEDSKIPIWKQKLVLCKAFTCQYQNCIMLPFIHPIGICSILCCDGQRYTIVLQTINWPSVIRFHNLYEAVGYCIQPVSRNTGPNSELLLQNPTEY